MFAPFLLIVLSLSFLLISCIPILILADNSPTIIYFLLFSTIFTLLFCHIIRKTYKNNISWSHSPPQIYFYQAPYYRITTAKIFSLISVCMACIQFFMSRDKSYLELHSVGFTTPSGAFNIFTLVFPLFSTIFIAKNIARTGRITVSTLLISLSSPLALFALGFRMPFISSVITLCCLQLSLQRATFSSICKYLSLIFCFIKEKV